MIDLPSISLIGVIHLPALPGSPNHTGMDAVLERAMSDARILVEAGFNALIIENFGDQPFSATDVGPATIAGMARTIDRIAQITNVPLGVNVLRNDAMAALGIASATSASFIRVNVHTGVMVTDQGMIEGQAAKTLRYRKLLGKRVCVLADVHVKHAVPLGQQDLGDAAKETAYRGMADGLIISGVATGSPTDPRDIDVVRNAVPDRRLFVGSGVTHETVGELLGKTGGVIVGTALKQDGITVNPVDPDRAKAFVQAAGLA